MNGPRPIQKRMTKSKVNKQGARFDPKQAAAQLRSAIVNEAPRLYARVRELEAERDALRNALASIALSERDTTSGVHEKLRDMARIARAALAGEKA